MTKYTKNDQGLREQVAVFIQENPDSTLRDIATGLDQDKYRSSISARINELYQSNIILVSGQTECAISGKQVNIYSFNFGQVVPLQTKGPSKKELETENLKLKQSLDRAKEIILYIKNHNSQSVFVLENFLKSEQKWMI